MRPVSELYVASCRNRLGSKVPPISRLIRRRRFKLNEEVTPALSL